MLLYVRLGWELPGDQWHGIASRKSHGCCIVSGNVPSVASLTVLGERGELKNWMFEQQMKKEEMLRLPVFLKGVLLKD